MAVAMGFVALVTSFQPGKPLLWFARTGQTTLAWLVETQAWPA